MTKARGEGFFAAVETRPYRPRGVLLGQATDDSCVPACVRMLLLDNLPHLENDHRFSESFLRGALETTDEGSSVAHIPAVLQEMGVVRPYDFRTDLTLSELRASAQSGAALVLLRTVFPESAHVVLVEEVTDEIVALRAPLPLGAGSAYTVGLQEFAAAWYRRNSDVGCAVIVLE
jgi:filamentous hemagglutinin